MKKEKVEEQQQQQETKKKTHENDWTKNVWTTWTKMGDGRDSVCVCEAFW